MSFRKMTFRRMTLGRMALIMTLKKNNIQQNVNKLAFRKYIKNRIKNNIM